MQPAIGRISFDIMGNIGEGVAGRTSYVDDNFIEIFAGHMMPNRELADSAQAVDSQL